MTKSIQTERDNTFAWAMGCGNSALDRQAESMKNIQQTQDQLLLSLMEHNRHTEFGLNHGFEKIDSYEEFCSRVPLSTYQDYKDSVRRMVQEGKSGILFQDDNYCYMDTSGTSGRNKYIPVCASTLDAIVEDLICREMAMTDRKYMQEHGQHLTTGSLLLLMGGRVGKTQIHGERIGNIGVAGVLRAHEWAGNILVPPRDVSVFTGEGLYLSPYTLLRYALSTEDLKFIIALYDDFVLMVLHYLQQNWKELCDDVEAGVVGPLSGVSEEIREKYSRRDFVPQPERAAELREILKNGLQKDTLKRIWPTLQMVAAAKKVNVTESRVPLPYYLSGIYYDNSPYGATECVMGASAELGSDEIVLIPDGFVYEFIPEDAQEPDKYAKLLRMHELEDGRNYEIVITTHSGLYRYCIGDVLRVTGRIGNCPTFHYICRKGIALNLFNEKTSELAVRNAVVVAAVKYGISLAGYSVYGGGVVSGEQGVSTAHYVVQCEVKGGLTEEIQKVFAHEIDCQLCYANENYQQERQSCFLQDLRVELLPEGTFQKYDTARRAASASPAQYKRPLVVRLEP